MYNVLPTITHPLSFNFHSPPFPLLPVLPIPLFPHTCRVSCTSSPLSPSLFPPPSAHLPPSPSLSLPSLSLPPSVTPERVQRILQQCLEGGSSTSATSRESSPAKRVRERATLKLVSSTWSPRPWR